MKKLLIILMVVAMASFLFVGCIPTTPDVDEDDEEPIPTPPVTVAPIITSVPDISGGYINKANAADGIVVNGTAPTYSEVKVYINGLTAGTGDTEANGVFQVVVANVDLIKSVKTDGAKVLYATATEPGLAESASSNEKTFTLDTVIPSIASSVAKAGAALSYRFVETTDTTNALSAPGCLTGNFQEALVPGGLAISVGTPSVQIGEFLPSTTAAIPTLNPLLPGVVDWKIEVITIAGSDVTVKVTNLTAATSIDYTFTNVAISSTSWIPGTIVTVSTPFVPTNIGAYVLITTTNTVLSLGYVDVTFNEAVTGVSITGNTWTLFAATQSVANTPSVRSATVARLTEKTAGFMKVGVSYSVSVSGISDLAGNTISASAPSTSIGIVLP